MCLRTNFLVICGANFSSLFPIFEHNKTDARSNTKKWNQLETILSSVSWERNWNFGGFFASFLSTFLKRERVLKCLKFNGFSRFIRLVKLGVVCESEREEGFCNCIEIVFFLVGKTWKWVHFRKLWAWALLLYSLVSFGKCLLWLCRGGHNFKPS